MTTKALPAQYDAVRRLSQDAVGDEWWALDKHLDPDSATYEGLEAIRDALHRVLDEGKTLSLQGKKGMLESIMAGTWRPAPALDPPVETLIPEPDLAALRKALDEPAESLEQSAVPEPQLSGKPFTGRHGTKRAIDYHLAYGESLCEVCLGALQRVRPQPVKHPAPFDGSDSSPSSEEPKSEPPELTSGSSMHESRNQSVTVPETIPHPDPQPEEETLAKARKPLTPDDPRHGTSAGVSAHSRLKIPLCDPCREEKNRLQAVARVAKQSPKSARPPARKSPDMSVPRNQPRDWQPPSRTSVPSPTARTPIGRYLNLLLTLAESQDVPDPALLEKIDKLIGIGI